MSEREEAGRGKWSFEEWIKEGEVMDQDRIFRSAINA